MNYKELALQALKNGLRKQRRFGTKEEQENQKSASQVYWID
jgi:hypothetical protein